MIITGKTLIDLGYTPGPWFKNVIEIANDPMSNGLTLESIIDHFKPKEIEKIPYRASGELDFYINARAESLDEQENLDAVIRNFTELMRTPTIVSGAIMPDACPAGGPLGTIPVGGIVAANNAIHPGMHSADICCSMAISVFSTDTDPIQILDAGMKLSHFGPGGRPYSNDMVPPGGLLDEFEQNKFLNMLTGIAGKHFATQGDGNHFFYVGRLESTGQICLVTHHGSRGVGANLYKLGMDVAQKYTEKHSSDTPKHNAWIVADSEEGQEYWEALQLIRRWTKANHFAIHDAVAKYTNQKVKDRFWNEHNFVFQKSDGLFYHAKGATPAYPYFSSDTNNLTLIPLNMAQPILIVEGADNPKGLGFAPHGAGRNLSRTAHVNKLGQEFSVDARGLSQRDLETIVKRETEGLDIRFFSGKPDVSELPSAYKNADMVKRQIADYNLANLYDTIQPIGTIMAGGNTVDWKAKKKKNKP